MKKVLINCLFAFMAFDMTAQIAVIPGKAEDLLTNVDSSEYVYETASLNDAKVSNSINLVRTSGTGTITARVYTTNFNRTNWTHVSTTAIGTSAINVILPLAASLNLGRYTKVTISQTGTAATTSRLAYIIRKV